MVSALRSLREDDMIRTFIAYGYDLGGPGDWRFKGFGPGIPLRAPWYDEGDPTQDFAECALNVILTSAQGRPLRGPSRDRAEAAMPYMFDTAADFSPPGWTREAGAPPMPSRLIPAPPVGALDQPARNRYVLLAVDSVLDIDAIEDSFYDDEDEEPQPDAMRHWQTDWDSLLLAAVTELGLDIPGLPDWFWYRTGMNID